MRLPVVSRMFRPFLGAAEVGIAYSESSSRSRTKDQGAHKLDSVAASEGQGRPRVQSLALRCSIRAPTISARRRVTNASRASRPNAWLGGSPRKKTLWMVASGCDRSCAAGFCPQMRPLCRRSPVVADVGSRRLVR